MPGALAAWVPQLEEFWRHHGRYGHDECDDPTPTKSLRITVAYSTGSSSVEARRSRMEKMLHNIRKMLRKHVELVPKRADK